jgi:hypothetical protein
MEQPETTVAWEGDRASGTVELAAAGLGTTVTPTAGRRVPSSGPGPPGRTGEMLGEVLDGPGWTALRSRPRD